MKKLILVGALTLLVTPYLASAGEDHDKDDKPHRHLNATEFVTGGLAAAALLGVAGYVVLRRRGTRQD